MTTAKKPASLAERLARARAISNEINAATDDLNAELAELQRKFAALRLGVEACVPLSLTEDEDDHDYFRDLWFEKVNADWLFTIRSGLSFDDGCHTTPLLKASKALRLESAHKMPELLEALIQKAEKQVEEVEEATTVVKDVGKLVDEANGTNVGGSMDAEARAAEELEIDRSLPVEQIAAVITANEKKLARRVLPGATVTIKEGGK